MAAFSSNFTIDGLDAFGNDLDFSTGLDVPAAIAISVIAQSGVNLTSVILPSSLTIYVAAGQVSFSNAVAVSQSITVGVISGVFSEFTTTLYKPAIQSRRYICTITGAADGLSDAVIPISSFNLRSTNKGMSTLAVVCPDGVNSAELIAQRANGGLIISAHEVYSDGTEAVTHWDEFAITALSDSKGPTSYSVTLTAQHVGVIHLPRRRITLSGVSLVTTNESGHTRVRANPDKDLLPGDTAITDGVELVASVVTTYVSQDGLYMEVADG